jgi:hypothetical protein
MSSPFSTIEEFQGAIDGPTGGAIYTFASSPAINTIALLLGIALFFWFLFRTFSTRYGVPGIDKSLNHLSTFIVAGLLTLAGLVEHRQPPAPHQPAEARTEAAAPDAAPASALGLLGLVGIGLPIRQRRSPARRSHPQGRYRTLRR